MNRIQTADDEWSRTRGRCLQKNLNPLRDIVAVRNEDNTAAVDIRDEFLKDFCRFPLIQFPQLFLSMQGAQDFTGRDRRCEDLGLLLKGQQIEKIG